MNMELTTYLTNFIQLEYESWFRLRYNQKENANHERAFALLENDKWKTLNTQKPHDSPSPFGISNHHLLPLLFFLFSLAHSPHVPLNPFPNLVSIQPIMYTQKHLEQNRKILLSTFTHTFFFTPFFFAPWFGSLGRLSLNKPCSKCPCSKVGKLHLKTALLLTPKEKKRKETQNPSRNRHMWRVKSYELTLCLSLWLL